MSISTPPPEQIVSDMFEGQLIELVEKWRDQLPLAILHWHLTIAAQALVADHFIDGDEEEGPSGLS